ncbi:MAG: MFS transporter [Proteobacteria bacterium]|nr:MFS transporter [Pseudomonadota bacterium]
MDTKLVNVTNLINGRPISRYQYSIFLLCALAALMDGYDSVIIGITAPAIAQSLGLDVKTFGPVFSAAQFGFMLGAFIAGPLADRMGRKSILIGSVLVFGAFSLLTPAADTYNHLLILRFITGLGLGGASATFVSICTEYSPGRVRATIISVLWALLPAGNVLGGVLSSIILPSHGWTPVYYIGGIVPLLIALVMLLMVPESVSFLVTRRAPPARISGIVGRLAPDIALSASTQYAVNDAGPASASVGHLFDGGRRFMTICYWVSFFCCWLVLITVLAWTVPVLREAGLPISMASLMIAANSAGAVIGAPIIGRVMDKADPELTVAIGLLVGAAAVLLLGFSVTSANLLAVNFFVAGFAVGGTSAGMVGLVATAYPTAIRSTGIGWAIGVARLGAVCGPIAAGMMLGGGWGLKGFFATMAVITLVAALGILTLRQADRR